MARAGRPHCGLPSTSLLTTLDLLTTPVIAGLLFTGTLALVALMAWRGGSERRDVTFLASAAGFGGVCTAIAVVV